MFTNTGSEIIKSRFTNSTKLDICLILGLPLLLLCVSTNWIFTATGYIDPWLYLGFCRNFTAYQADLFSGTYYGSRLGFILPGIACHSIFPPIVANIVLHLYFYYLASFSLYYTTRAFFGNRSAILATILMGGYPFFQRAVGWDYLDGAGLAYLTLSVALTAKAIRSAKPRLWLVLAGAASGAMVHSQLFLLGYLFVCPLLYTCVRPYYFPEGIAKRTVEMTFGLLCGGVVLTLGFGIINYYCGGLFFFFAPSFQFAKNFVSNPNPWKAENYEWLKSAVWLFMSYLAVLSSLVILIKYRFRCALRPKGAIASWFAVAYLLLFLLMIAWEFKGTPVLQYSYYASYLIPNAFMVMGIMLAGLFDEGYEASSSGWYCCIGLAAGAALLAQSTWLYDRLSELRVRPHGFPMCWAILGLSIMLVVGTQFMRRLPAVRLLLSVFGMCVIIVAFSTPSKDDRMAAYTRIVSACSAMEAKLEGRRPRFWYNAKEPLGNEFVSLSSVYLWGCSLINDDFPAVSSKVHGDGTSRFAGSLLVIPSSDAKATDAAFEALSVLGLSGRLVERLTYSVKTEIYFVNLIEVLDGEELDIRFDGRDASFNCMTQKPAALPPPELVAGWQTVPGAEATNLFLDDALLGLKTHAQEGTCAIKLGPFYVDEDAELKFSITYREVMGRVILGVLGPDGKDWAAKSPGEFRKAEYKTQDVSFQAKKGVPFWLGMGNLKNGHKGPTEIRLKTVDGFVSTRTRQSEKL